MKCFVCSKSIALSSCFSFGYFSSPGVPQTSDISLFSSSDRSVLEEERQKLVEALIENFLEPDKNGLIWRSA